MAIQFSKLKVGDYLKVSNIQSYNPESTYLKVVSISEDGLPIKLLVIGEYRREMLHWQIPKSEYWGSVLTKVNKKEAYIEMI